MTEPRKAQKLGAIAHCRALIVWGKLCAHLELIWLGATRADMRAAMQVGTQADMPEGMLVVTRADMRAVNTRAAGHRRSCNRRLSKTKKACVGFGLNPNVHSQSHPCQWI